MGRRIIVSISSDIGAALASAWLSEGHSIAGTYRTPSSKTEDLRRSGVDLVKCDLSNDEETDDAALALCHDGQPWDTLVLAPGLQDPVGSFSTIDFDEWSRSITVNFVNQMRIIHRLLPYRNEIMDLGPMVLMFAGGGTNNATQKYSAYTISKIAEIKMCELFDAEIPNMRFSILGPGWVKTKIHQSTLDNPIAAGDNFDRTKIKLESDECVPMSKVIECCNWIINSPREMVSGRNFACAWDKWGDTALETALKLNPDMFKLRRDSNDVLIRSEPWSEKNS